MTGNVSPRRVLALAAVMALALNTQASADTQCDADPNAVFFEPTVDATVVNNLLARLGSLDVNVGSVPLRVDGICVDHQIALNTGFSQVPVSDAPVTTTPRLGSLNVMLDIMGPFNFGIDGSQYTAIGCASGCRVEIPYIGEVFDACAIEAGLAAPVFGLLQANVGFDDIRVSQTADTCVLGDCTAIHPEESTSANIFNFNVDVVGSCNISIDFPDPFPDPPSLDICAGIDGIIEDLVEPELEDAIADAFVNRDGEGILIQVFSRQIVKDGCANIPEVKECKDSQTAGLLRGPRNPLLNAALYLLPLGLVGGLALRVRRRRRD